MNRWDIINSFIEKHNYKSYLEIGYYKGWSFDQVMGKSLQIKVATDPNPCKTSKEESLEYGARRLHMLVGEFDTYEDATTEVLYKLTSDNFFEVEKDCVFDIIFIDGLHEAKQVEKDIQNSLKHLSPGGTIILHDCNPPKYEHTTTGIDGCWTGDAYKAWVGFRYEHPEYVTYTIDTDWGVGIIETPYEIYGNDGIGKSGKILDWQTFDRERKELLNLISVEKFKTKMNEGTTDNNSPAQ